jgi:hypothetical protein
MPKRRMSELPEVPVVDIRIGGPVAHAAARRAAMEELRGACLGCFPAVARSLVPVGDAIARRWLERSTSPYTAEVIEIARLTERPGVFLVNTSYEWGCTAACCGEVPSLVRTLDWPFAGLGRGLTVARQAGPAGEFWNVTWPGAVGVLTALAPGRFAATINQAPLYRRTRGDVLRWIDYAANAIRTYARVRFAPPAHVLRQVFETASNYGEAKEMLSRLPMARPSLIALVGTRPGESCVIERTETQAWMAEGPFAVANDWQSARVGWEPRSCGRPVELDSRERRDALSACVGAIKQPFDWLKPPVHNWATRVAVEMCAADGTLRVIGLEPVGGDRPAVHATQMLDLARVHLAA